MPRPVHASRLASRRSALLVAAAIALAAVPALAGELPTSVRGGETVGAEINPAGESDDYEITLFAGDRLRVKVKDAGPVRSLKSTISLALPDGSPATGAVVAWNNTIKPTLDFTATTDGAHRLRLIGGEGTFTGSNGNYTVQFIVTRAKPAPGTFAGAAAGDIVYTFAATDGAKVTLNASTKKGGLELTSLDDPDGDPEPGFAAALKASKNGRSAAVKNLVVAGGAGRYVLRGTYDAGSSVVVRATVVHAEKARRRPLGEEPKIDPLLLPFPAEGVIGTMIHVVGTGFSYRPASGTAEDVYPVFRVGGVVVPRDTVERPNGSLYRFPAPAGLAVGARHDLVVENTDGQRSIAEDAFLVVPPPSAQSIAAVDGGTVAAGPAGGRRLRITGTNFRSGSVVFFGTTPAQPSLTLATRIDVTAPARAAGDVTVRVRDEYGQETTLPGTFPYMDVGSNTIASIDLDFLQGIGGETVTVSGSSIGADTVLTIDGIAANATRLSSSQLSFVTPPRADGTSSLRVTDALEQPSSLNVTVKGFSDRTATSIPVPNTGTGAADGWRATRALCQDVNGDARKDLILLQSAAAFGSTVSRSRVRVLLANSNGSFQDVTGTSIPNVSGDEDWRARDGALGDFDHDGDPDLAIVADAALSDGTRSALRILENDGTGRFLTDRTTAWLPVISDYGDSNQGVAVAAGDVNGDGWDDLVVAHSSSFQEDVTTVIDPGQPGANPPVPPTIFTVTHYYPGLRVLVNDRAGHMVRTLSAAPAVGANDPYRYEADAMAFGDVTGDGRPDVFLTRDTILEAPAGTYVRTGYLLVMNGAGVLTDESGVRLPTASDPEYLQADRALFADADGDGDRDLFLLSNQALVSPATGTVATTPALRLFTNSSGSFLAAGPSVFPAKDQSDVLQGDGLAVGDLDGDGGPDIVVVSNRAPNSGGRGCRVLRRSGTAWVQASLCMPNPATGDDGHGTDVHLTDLAGDGDLDVVLFRDDADETVKNTRLLFNQRR